MVLDSEDPQQLKLEFFSTVERSVSIVLDQSLHMDALQLKSLAGSHGEALMGELHVSQGHVPGLYLLRKGRAVRVAMYHTLLNQS